MRSEDHYSVLGVPRTATDGEIRSAYRRQARLHHPDVNPGDEQAEEMFRAASEAYQVLSDPEKRMRYDELSLRRAKRQQWEDPGQPTSARTRPEGSAAERSTRGIAGGFRLRLFGGRIELRFGAQAGTLSGRTKRTDQA